jgi:hypothetical protein
MKTAEQHLNERVHPSAIRNEVPLSHAAIASLQVLLRYGCHIPLHPVLPAYLSDA